MARAEKLTPDFATLWSRTFTMLENLYKHRTVTITKIYELEATLKAIEAQIGLQDENFKQLEAQLRQIFGLEPQDQILPDGTIQWAEPEQLPAADPEQIN
jgi:outer membrane protein TolC